jgi:hypothetical protein
MLSKKEKGGAELLNSSRKGAIRTADEDKSKHKRVERAK